MIEKTAYISSRERSDRVYIPEFLCGIIATLAVEGGLFYIALLLADKGEVKKGE